MSRSAKTSTERRADLERAIKATKRGEMIPLKSLSALWGVSEGRFINIRNTIAKFPDPVKGENQSLHYPRLAVLKALLAHEQRNDAAVAARQEKLNRLLGRAEVPAKPQGRAGLSSVEEVSLPPTELLRLDDLNTRAERRAIAQGELARRDDIRQTASKVFSLLSNRIGNLDAQIDPNGTLDPMTRARLKKAGGDLLLRIHTELNDMLASDADEGPVGTPAPRGRGRAAR